MKPKSHLVTSVHVEYGKCYILKTVSKLAFPIQAYDLFNQFSLFVLFFFWIV